MPGGFFILAGALNLETLATTLYMVAKIDNLTIAFVTREENLLPSEKHLPSYLIHLPLTNEPINYFQYLSANVIKYGQLGTSVWPALCWR